jgi:lipoate-protein ligase B
MNEVSRAMAVSTVSKPSDMNDLIDARHKIDVIDLGRMRYGEALQRQETMHEQVVNAPSRHTIFTVEHEPVLTMGKNSDGAHLLFPRDFYLQQGIEIFETERGGQVTAHMPGQLVIYPILNMTDLQLSVRDYVWLLEESVIATLSIFGIKAHRDDEHPGVWVAHQKICAIGVRVKARTSMHGLALNIDNDLSLFGKIVPCGIKFRGVTSMARLLNANIDFHRVQSLLLDQILGRLSYRRQGKNCT